MFELLAFEFTIWDLALILVVTTQSLLVAYAESPKLKSLFLSLPLPFTTLALSVGRPVDASNIASLYVLLVYTQVVRVLRNRFGVPIVPSIAIGVAVYALIGWALADVTPTTDGTFWIACAVTIPVGIWLHRRISTTTEIPFRTNLPLTVKLPVVMSIVVLLVTAKHALAGFAPFFPLVSVVGAYETRHTLWTLARPVPMLMVAITPMLVVARLVQPHAGLGVGLALGWVIFLPLLLWIRGINGTEETSLGEETPGSAKAPA